MSNTLAYNVVGDGTAASESAAVPTPTPTPVPKAKTGAIHPYGSQPPDDTDADLDAEADANEATGCIEMHGKLHELDLNIIYSDWTGWMVPALGVAAVLDVALYYFLDRGGMFRPANVIDPNDAGVSTVVDPRELLAWLTVTAYGLAAALLVYTHHTCSACGLLSSLGAMACAACWLVVRCVFQLSFTLTRAPFADTNYIDMNIWICVYTFTMVLQSSRYGYILYAIHVRVKEGEDLPEMEGLFGSSRDNRRSGDSTPAVGYDAAERAAIQRSLDAKARARARNNGGVAGDSGRNGNSRRLEEGKGLGSDSRYRDEEGMFEEEEVGEVGANGGQPKKFSQARVTFGNAGPSSGPTLSRAVGSSSSTATGTSGSGGGVMVIGASGAAVTAGSGTDLWTQKNSGDRDYL